MMVAKDSELPERPIIRASQLLYEKRVENIAIKSRHEIHQLVVMRKIRQEKLDEYDRYPLSSQLGFLHAIPEEDFNMSTVTIIDVSFLGLFPKKIFQTLRNYELENKRLNYTGSKNFRTLMDNLITAVIYRPITIQKVIQIMLAQHKQILATAEQATANCVEDNTTASAINSFNITSVNDETPTRNDKQATKQKCFASKCRLLQARGFIKHAMYCKEGRNMCSGCTIEIARHRKTLQLEKELLMLTVDNQVLSPLLTYWNTIISEQAFQEALSCLPTFNTKSRDDLVYGAARYLANTLGILIHSTTSSNLMDPPMTSTEKRRAWRKSTFMCRYENDKTISVWGARSFCTSCQYLVPHKNITHVTKCPGCNISESWEHIGFPCLACQFANMVCQNPFASRYEILLNTWLPLPTDLDNSSEVSESVTLHTPEHHTNMTITSTIDYTDLMRMRRQAINESLDTVRTTSSKEQNQMLFDDLVSLKRNLMDNNNDKQYRGKTNNHQDTYSQMSNSSDSLHGEHKEGTEYNTKTIGEDVIPCVLNNQEEIQDK